MEGALLRLKSLIFFLLSISAFGQNYWPEAKISSIFNTLYTEGASAAILEVEANAVTAYDFGVDLILTGDHQRALAWYSALSAGGADKDRFLFGKAWVQMELGVYQAAIETSAELMESSESELVKARSHYLLAVIFKKSGLQSYSLDHLDQSEALYEGIGKLGGVTKCRSLRTSGSNKAGSAPAPIDANDE